MSLPLPSNERLQTQASLWKEAPIWRKTVMLATVATVASASLFFISGADKNPENVKTPQAMEKVTEKSNASEGSTVKSIPSTQIAEGAAQIKETPGSALPHDVSKTKPPMPLEGSGTQDKAVLRSPTPGIAIQKPLPLKAAATPRRTQVALSPVPESISAQAAITPPPSVPLPSAMAGAISELTDASCPELLRRIPNTEPKYLQSQVMTIRPADFSTMQIRKGMTELNATIDAKYQYQVMATMFSKNLQSQRRLESAVVPADLRVMPGDIVAWDGAYRDQPGRCHYMPSRIRAVLRHEELPIFPEHKEAVSSETAR